MAAARHKMPPEIASLSLDEIAERYIGRFRDKIPDWEAFEDAKIDGYRRAQHRFIGAGGSGNASPARLGSSTASRTRASNRCISRSCSARDGPMRWAMPMTGYTSAATRISAAEA